MNSFLIFTCISSMLLLNYVTGAYGCTIGEWPCRNGSCIPIKDRCDAFPNCADQSDEVNCTGKVCQEGLILCQHSNGSQFCTRDGTQCESALVSTTDKGIAAASPTNKFFSTTVHVPDTTAGVAGTRSYLSIGHIVGITIGSLAFVVIVVVVVKFVIKRVCKGNKVGSI